MTQNVVLCSITLFKCHLPVYSVVCLVFVMKIKISTSRSLNDHCMRTLILLTHKYVIHLSLKFFKFTQRIEFKVVLNTKLSLRDKIYYKNKSRLRDYAVPEIPVIV